MLLQVDFGAAQTGIGYRFYDNTGAFVGARITSGINAAPEAGVYVVNATVPSGAIGVYWDCADADFTASEDLTSARTVVAGRPIDVDSSGQAAVQEDGGGSSGSGAFSVTVTVTDGTNPLENARVRVTQGITSLVVLTDAGGVATFALDAATYDVGITKDGYQFTPSEIVVADAGNFDQAMTAVVVPAPDDASQATGYINTYDEAGAIASGVVLSFQMVAGPGDGAESFRNSIFAVTSADGTGDIPKGQVQQSFRRLATYRGRRGGSAWIQFVVPDSGTFPLPEILGGT